MALRVAFHASHEELGPRELLDCVREAEAAGFDGATCSDHVAPWSARQGESGNAWAWLGAAAVATDLPLGVVTAPGTRYHPAVAAQQIATVAQLAGPGRLWVALGSGQALNEHVTGTPWPPKAERERRHDLVAGVVRRLLAGEEVSHPEPVLVDRARVWSLPETPPPLLGAAVSPASAARVAAWADGLVTVVQPGDVLRELLDAWDGAGGGDRPRKLQVHVALAATRDAALELAHEWWREPALGGPVAWELALPEHLEAAAASKRPEDLEEAVVVATSAQELAERLAELAALGFDELTLHHVGREQRRFIALAGEELLPAVRAATA
jgi:probable non-F420 flavinoid oxidoreductase